VNIRIAKNDLVDALTEELGVPRKLANEFQVPLGLWHLNVRRSAGNVMMLPK
jgi:hypothetical protein